MSLSKLKSITVVVSIILGITAYAACGGSNDPQASNVTVEAVETEPQVLEPRPIPPPPGRVPDDPGTITVDDPLQSQVEMILSAYSLENQFRLIEHLAADTFQGRKTGSEGSRAAAAFIAQEFARMNLVPWSDIGLETFRHHFNESGFEDDNVIGVLPGSDPDGRFVIIAAHYDHLGLDDDGNAFSGADDNAAGVATVLEAAAILRQLDFTPTNTVVFCAFSGEEQGQRGSKALGKLIEDAGLVTRTEMINIDGIGATGGSYFGVWDQGNQEAAPLVNTMSQAGDYLGVPVVNEGTDIGSDAQSFNWDYGIPAITVDWDWGDDPSPYHPYYHTINDDAAAIDKPTLARATRVILVGMWLRASDSDNGG